MCEDVPWSRLPRLERIRNVATIVGPSMQLTIERRVGLYVIEAHFGVSFTYFYVSKIPSVYCGYEARYTWLVNHIMNDTAGPIFEKSSKAQREDIIHTAAPIILVDSFFTTKGEY